MANMVGQVLESHKITFHEDELPPEGLSHNRKLHITVQFECKFIARVLIDGSSSFNICLLTTLKRLGKDFHEIQAEILGDVVLMRLSPDGEEGTSRPDKGKKRKKEASAVSPKSEKPKVQMPRTDAKISTSAAMASPRAEDEGDADDECLLKIAESGVVDIDQTRTEETLEEGAGIVPEFQVEHGTIHADDSAASDSGGPEPEASRGRDETIRELNALGYFNLGHSYSTGEFWDAQDSAAVDIGASHKGEDVIESLLNGVDEDIDLNAPISLEEAKRMYDHAFSRLLDKLSCCRKEIEKLTSELKESKASSSQTGEELSRLRVNLEGVRQKRAGLDEQEEVAAKDAEILELRRQNEAVTSERDLLRKDLSSIQGLFRSAQKDAAVLFAAKATAEENASSYMKDAATANERAREIQRSPTMTATSKPVHQGEESFASASSSIGGTPPVSAIPWMPHEVPDLADWSRKLAACSTYDERIGEFSEMRSCPLGEEEESSALGSRTNNKRKESSKDEGAHSEAFDKLKSELLHWEARLRKACEGEKSLRIIYGERGKELRHLRYEGEIGQAKHECNKLRAKIDAHVAAKKNVLAKVFALEVQLQNTRENSSVQMSMIARLEFDFLEMKAKVVDALAEAEEIWCKANKKVVVYLKDIVEAWAELRGVSDQENRSNEYARCKLRRETLKEIHARGFDLSEEIV
ncbi:uncharacterized protein [Nicotiana sylvestris]|uniref:uncharacterized protein n=1 Tax=Nicotiana sylvestris TaxID=4096 RepID=UPI00388C5009